MCSTILLEEEFHIHGYTVTFECLSLLFLRIKKKKTKVSAPCEDRTHDLQISTSDYETDALPTALTRHLLRYLIFFLLPMNII